MMWLCVQPFYDNNDHIVALHLMYVPCEYVYENGLTISAILEPQTGVSIFLELFVASTVTQKLNGLRWLWYETMSTMVQLSNIFNYSVLYLGSVSLAKCWNVCTCARAHTHTHCLLKDIKLTYHTTTHVGVLWFAFSSSGKLYSCSADICFVVWVNVFLLEDRWSFSNSQPKTWWEYLTLLSFVYLICVFWSILHLKLTCCV